MTNSKFTKRALLTSVFAIIVCLAMLIGTTFAWFTDTASTAVNKIQAGNLDIDVEYTLDGTNWTKLDEATDLFQKGLWEPGHTEIVGLKIKNAGNLALKYNIGLNVVADNVGINKDNQEYRLSSYLKVKTHTMSAPLDDMNDYMSVINAFAMAFTSRSDMGIPYTDADFADLGALCSDVPLIPDKEDHLLLLKVYMPETVGNEANARSAEEAASIDFGINVVATQYTYENDSFGTDYDEDAPTPVLFNQSNAFNDGVVFQNKGYLQVKNASVILTEDIDLSNTKIRPNISQSNSTLYLDLNGHDLIVSQMSVSAGTATMIISDSVGTGSIRFVNSGADGISVTNGTLIMNSGTLYGPEDKSGGSAVKLTWGTFIMNGGKIVANSTGNDAGSTAVSIFASNSSHGAKFIMNGGEIEKTVGTYAAIQASGTLKNTTIEINDGSIKSNTVAIYHPQAGSLTVNGGYIEGETAIYAKAGTLTFNGGKMHATAETATDYTYTDSGMYVTGDAVVIEACGYNNGNNPIVTVAGGTFTTTAKNAHGFAYYKHGDNVATITNTAGIDIYEK